MSFPAGVQIVTVAAPANGFRTLDGAYQTGTITLTPSVREVVSAEHGIIAVGEINFTIGASGTFTPREVLPVDAEGFSPSGWTYRVDRALTGETPRSYNVSIPASAGSVDLSALIEVEASDGVVVYGPAAPNGPAGGDLSGSYPNPTVSRVNGVTVSGSPAVGQVPTATSSTTATWQTPAGGGGGGGTPADTVTAETAFGQSASAGVAGTFSRGDHTHGSPSLTSSAASTSLVGAAAAAGSASTAARADHVHGRESFGAVTAQTSFGAASGNGTASTPARSDHTHGTPTLPSASTSAAGVVQLDGTAADIQALGVQAAGSIGKAADAGHVHPTTGLVLTTDPRLTDNRTPSGSASGDLSGTYPGPTVAKVAGVAVSGTPSSGQVLTASSSSAASWQTPTGSGGGAVIRTADVRLTPGDVALASSASWAVVSSSGTPLAASITAAVGDRIQASPSFMRTGSGCFLDLTILDSGGAISRYFGTDSSTPLSEGHPSYYPQASSFPGVPGTMQIVVGSGEVDGTGKVTIALAYKGSGGETIYADSTYPWYMLLTNLGPEPA